VSWHIWVVIAGDVAYTVVSSGDVAYALGEWDTVGGTQLVGGTRGGWDAVGG